MKATLLNSELILHGSVGLDFWEDDGLVSGDVRAVLVGMDGEITVRLNSGGGDAFEGAAIHSVLSAYPGKVTVYVEGIAASAASLIAMAGDEIVMTEGSMMMIHDPSGMTWGTADDHRWQADALDKIATEYAGIYARRCGSTPEKVREDMKAEIWMGGEEAVERGFADRVEKRETAVAAYAFPYQKFASAPERLVAMAREQSWGADGLRPLRAALPAEKEEANMAAKDTTADKDTPIVEMKVDKPSISPDQQKVLDAAERRTAVMSIAGSRLTAEEVEKIVAGHKDPAEAKMAAVDMIAEKRMAEEPSPTKPAAQITEDEQERDYNARVDALSATMFGTKLEGAGTKFRGLTPKRLAMELAGGIKMGMSDLELIKAGMGKRGVLMAGGMHSTSDFTYLTADTMNRALRAAYDSRPGTWRQISRQRTATDFRTLYSVQAGVDTEMKTVNEAGEYEATVVSDTGESFAVVRRGRMVNLTFELIVNDDMSALSRLPQDFARGATNSESKVVWDLINANGNMSDGTAIFATGAARRNLASSGGAISVSTVGAGRKAMWEQRPQGAKATGADFIAATPNLLFVPPAIEVVALQFVTATTPDSDGNTNPFKSTLDVTVEPRLGAQVTGGSDTAWYLFDSSLPTVEHAFLQGYESPMVTPTEEMNPKGVTLMAEHIFGAGVVEFRGAYKNAGA